MFKHECPYVYALTLNADVWADIADTNTASMTVEQRDTHLRALRSAASAAYMSADALEWALVSGMRPALTAGECWEIMESGALALLESRTVVVVMTTLDASAQRDAADGEARTLSGVY